MSWISQQDFDTKCQNALNRLSSDNDVGSEQLAIYITDEIAQEGIDTFFVVVAGTTDVGVFGNCSGPWVWSGTANGNTYKVAIYWG
ncbi:MAG: hypothetical protein ACRC67_43680 [Inquilinus sp.]|uniref:hypothetical protein n=1 Tax=Inquilinus sp. TaxID=1932117 RepID=UPI003F2CF05F